MAHILVDTANTFFRARHVIRGDTSEKVGMAIHIMMNSIKKKHGKILMAVMLCFVWKVDHLEKTYMHLTKGIEKKWQML